MNLILRRNKSEPITRLEFDNNMKILTNRVDLVSNQTITGVKTFENFCEQTIPLDDYSDLAATQNFLESKVSLMSGLATDNEIITGTKIFESGITASAGNACTKAYYDSKNQKSINFSTEHPTNPDSNPIAKVWVRVQLNQNKSYDILDVYLNNNGLWDRV